MTNEEVEQEILRVVATETSAIAMSDKLFTPQGLFGMLAKTKEERRVMIQSPLYKKAQRRFRELQFAEAEAFGKAVAEIEAAGLGSTPTPGADRVKISERPRM